MLKAEIRLDRRLAIGKLIGTGGGWIAGSASKVVANI
jgi:hypothetical protein